MTNILRHFVSDVEEGGETAFPHSTWIDKDIQTAGKNFSDCTEGGVAVKPKRGDALLFWGLKPNLRHLDYPSMHTGCPVIKGVKWSATKWIHTQPLQGNLMSRLAAAAKARAERQPPCQNNEPECEEWALDGECEKNAEFMNRECAKSCKACCLPGDLLCLRSRIRQRNAAGMAVNTNR